MKSITPTLKPRTTLLSVIILCFALCLLLVFVVSAKRHRTAIDSESERAGTLSVRGALTAQGQRPLAPATLISGRVDSDRKVVDVSRLAPHVTSGPKLYLTDPKP